MHEIPDASELWSRCHALARRYVTDPRMDAGCIADDVFIRTWNRLKGGLIWNGDGTGYLTTSIRRQAAREKRRRMHELTSGIHAIFDGGEEAAKVNAEQADRLTLAIARARATFPAAQRALFDAFVEAVRTEGERGAQAVLARECRVPRATLSRWVAGFKDGLRNAIRAVDGDGPGQGRGERKSSDAG